MNLWNHPMMQPIRPTCLHFLGARVGSDALTLKGMTFHRPGTQGPIDEQLRAYQLRQTWEALDAERAKVFSREKRY